MSPGRWLAPVGGLVTLAALGGLWHAASRAESAERDRADAAHARMAGAYLSVVVPGGGAQGYDPPRLLSAVNTLSRASYWPGGLQVALGAVPLLPDTIGLVPVPDSLLRLLDEGQLTVLTDHGRKRAAIAPFLDRDRWGILGWAAAWGTVQPRLPSLSAAAITILAAASIGVTALVFRRGGGRRWRMAAVLAGPGLLALLAGDLGWSARFTARAAAETRLRTLKRLIEVAATAPGVRQAMLPEIAIDVQVRPRRGRAESAMEVRWGRDDQGPIMLAVAATPRSQGGLELTLRPDMSGLARLRLELAGWLAVGGAGLWLTAWGARRRGRPDAPVAA